MQVKGVLFSLLGLACVSEAYAMPCGSNNNMSNAVHTANTANTRSSMPNNSSMSMMDSDMHPKMYISLESGISIPKISSADSATFYGDKSFKVGIPLGAEIGYNFNDAISVGINFSHRSHKFDNTFTPKDPTSPAEDLNYTANQKFKNTAILLGAKYSFDISGFSPYIGVGVGVTLANAGDYRKSETGAAVNVVNSIAGKNKMQFAWNIGLGVQKHFGDWNVGLGYRYLDLGKMQTTGFQTTSTMVNVKETVNSISLVDPISTSLKAHDVLLSIGYSF